MGNGPLLHGCNESEGGLTHTDVKLGFAPRSVELTNMLEEKQQVLASAEQFQLTFHPFEIKTLKIRY